MILRKTDTRPAPERARPAWQVFLESQRGLEPPYAVICQPEHSRLAGDLATALITDAFGELTPAVLDAIRQHDQGWQVHDDAQLAAVGRACPKPFPAIAPPEAHACWAKSIERAAGRTLLEGIITSRHFCAIAQADPSHAPFLAREIPRRVRMEEQAGISAAELNRYTAAIGFCDLVSLYLCSDAREPVEVPLAHPSLQESRNARRVLIGWTNERPRFAPPVFTEGTRLSFAGLERRDSGSPLSPAAWQVTL